MQDDKRPVDDEDSDDAGEGTKARGESEKAAEGKIDDFIAAAHRLAAAVGGASVFSDNGITVADWSLLKAVGDEKNAPLNEVAKRSGIPRARLRTLLLGLEGKGLVLVKQEGDDKRSLAITLSHNANDVLVAVAAAFERIAESNPSLAKAGGKRFGSGARLAARLTNAVQRADSPRKAEGGRAAKEKPAAEPFDGDEMDDD